MKLSIDKKPSFEKTASVTQLSHNTEDWVHEINNEVYSQLPFLSGRNISVEMREVNDSNKSGLGVVKVASKDKMMVLPIIIKRGILSPFDTMLVEGKPIPASEKSANEYFFEPEMFDEVVKKKDYSGNVLLDESLFPGETGITGTSSDSRTGIIHKVAETIHKDKIENLRKKIEKDSYLKPRLLDRLKDLKGIEQEKTAEVKFKGTLDAFIMYKKGSIIKGLGLQMDPFNIISYEDEQFTKEASELLKDKDTLMVGKGKGLFFTNDFETKTGKVDIPGRGIGYLFKEVVDLEGNLIDANLYIGDKDYALQEKIAGRMVLDKVFYESEPAGHGIYYFTSGDKQVATYPLSVEGEEKEYTICTDSMGNTHKLAFSEAVDKPTKLEDNTYLLPKNSRFIPLPNKCVDVPRIESRHLKEANKVTVGYITPNFNISGIPVDKDLEYLPKEAASLVLLGLGANTSQVKEILKIASERNSIHFYTNKKIKFGKEKVDAVGKLLGNLADKIASINMLNEIAVIAEYIKKDKKVFSDIFKTAGTINSPEDTIDNLLSLNFVTQDNISNFVDTLPQLKDTSSVLAGMVIASRLGVTSLPEQAIKVATRNLMEVIKALKLLKSGQTPSV